MMCDRWSGDWADLPPIAAMVREAESLGHADDDTVRTARAWLEHLRDSGAEVAI